MMRRLTRFRACVAQCVQIQQIQQIEKNTMFYLILHMFSFSFSFSFAAASL